MSILTGLSPRSVCDDPFPHIVVEDVLESGLCERLIDEYPPFEWFTGGSADRHSTKIQFSALDILNKPELSPVWREFISAHIATDIWKEIEYLFGDHLRAEHPHWMGGLDNSGHERAGVRNNTDDLNQPDILIDAQLSIHTPAVDKPQTDRGPHLKNLNKPFVAFLFLPPEDDQMHGGDLELYSIRPGAVPKFGPQLVIDPLSVRLEKTIPYKKNTLVAFLNTERSVQGFSVRAPGGQPMRYFNLIATSKNDVVQVDTDYTYFDEYHRVICPGKIAKRSKRWPARIWSRLTGVK